MNRELVMENAKKKFKGELLDIVITQINDYFQLADSNYAIEKNIKLMMK